jgi:hypothetical protein
MVRRPVRRQVLCADPGDHDDGWRSTRGDNASAGQDACRGHTDHGAADDSHHDAGGQADADTDSHPDAHPDADASSDNDNHVASPHDHDDRTLDRRRRLLRASRSGQSERRERKRGGAA